MSDPLSYYTFKRTIPDANATSTPAPVPEPTTNNKQSQVDERDYRNANFAIWANIDPSATDFTIQSQLKGGSYTEGEVITPRKVYSEKQFKEMHPNCAALERKPLTVDELRIIHDDYRREGTCRRALDFNAQIITGKRTDLEMSPTKGYHNEKREAEQIDLLNNDAENLDLLDELATIDRNVGFNDRMRELLVSGKCFGRSVLIKQYDEYGIPVRLIPLASIRLGKVYIDAETSEFVGCEYLDYQGDRNILAAEDIIHFENADYHITPGSRWFGMSALEPVMHIAAAIRVLQELAIPEIAKTMWAPALDVYVPGVKSQEKLDFISASLLPNKRWVHNYEAFVKTIETKADLRSLNDAIVELTKMIFRAVGVPLVIAYQDEQNRATAQAAINVTEATQSEYDRTRLRNVLEPQWYVPNLRAIMRRRQSRRSLAVGDNLQGLPSQPAGEELLQAKYPDGIVTALERSNRILELDPDSISLPFYPKMIFRPLELDTFLERTAATLAWLNAGALTVPMALEVGGLPQYKEGMVEELKKREADADAQIRIQMELAAAGQKYKKTTNPAGIETNGNSNKGGFTKSASKNPDLISKSAIPNFPVSTRQNVSASDLIRD